MSMPVTTRTGPSIVQLVDAPSFDAPASAAADGIAECDPAMKDLVSTVTKLQKMERHLLLIKSVIIDIIALEVAAAAPLDQREDLKDDVISPDSNGVVSDEVETVSENNTVKEKREGSKVKGMSCVVESQAANGSKSTESSEGSKVKDMSRAVVPQAANGIKSTELLEGSKVKDVSGAVVPQAANGSKSTELSEGSKVKAMSRAMVPQAASGSKSTEPSEERQDRSAHRLSAAVRHPLPLVEDREDAHAALIEPPSEDVFNEDVHWPRPGVQDRPPPSARLRNRAGGSIIRQRSRSVDSARTQTVIKHPPLGRPDAPTNRIAVGGPVNRKTPEIDRVPPPLPLTPPPTRLVRKATSMSPINRTRRRSKSASHKNTSHGLRNDTSTPSSQRSEDTSGNDQSAHS